MLAASFISCAYIRVHTGVVIDFQQPSLPFRIEQNIKTQNLIAGASDHWVILRVVRVYRVCIELHHISKDGESASACHLYIVLYGLHKLKIIDLL